MGRSGVKAVPSPRSFKPFWSSDDKIDTTRGKRGLDLPPIRQKTPSGASAAANGGSPFGVWIVSNRHDPPHFFIFANFSREAHPKVTPKKMFSLGRKKNTQPGSSHRCGLIAGFYTTRTAGGAQESQKRQMSSSFPSNG